MSLMQWVLSESARKAQASKGDSLCPAGLFFQGTDEPVSGLWGREVEQEEEVVHDALGAEDEEASQQRRL